MKRMTRSLQISLLSLHRDDQQIDSDPKKVEVEGRYSSLSSNTYMCTIPQTCLYTYTHTHTTDSIHEQANFIPDNLQTVQNHSVILFVDSMMTFWLGLSIIQKFSFISFYQEYWKLGDTTCLPTMQESLGLISNTEQQTYFL